MDAVAAEARESKAPLYRRWSSKSSLVVASLTALALITTTFPTGPQRNRAFSVYAAMSGAGAAVGLILGGWLTEYSWRWTFLTNVPVGIAAAVAATYLLSESQRHRGELDLPGALTVHRDRAAGCSTRCCRSGCWPTGPGPPASR